MKILLIGCGHMGGAMLAGWLKRPDIERIDVVDPTATSPADERVHMHTVIGPAVTNPDIVVLAVKPQVMREACEQIAPHLAADTPVVSIAAGVPLTRLVTLLGAARPYIRVMPNTPGAIGKGISGFYANEKTTAEQVAIVEGLLSALGTFVQVPDEKLIDAITAVSGSGPAYVFALTEAMEAAAIAIGLPPELAGQLAKETVIGAASLMESDKSLKPQDLRRSVTSRGGTTEAALDVLSKNQDLEKLMIEAVKAAFRRSQELAQSQ